MSVPEPDRACAARWRRELGLEGKKVVGFAGRWVEEKGFDVLLRALPHLLEAEPEARLVFAGEPNVVYERFFESCRPLLEEAGGKVTILGLVEGRQRMADFYAMCDVFALPSRSDMMALVQAEAMACGVPVVASDIPGARVVVRETGWGLLVPPESPAELAKALAEVLADPERFRPDPATVRERWSQAAAVARNEELLARLAGRRGGRSAG
jgi:glycosyltransferase involved in cell wall biosynthesis